MDKIFDLKVRPMEKLTLLTLGSFANDDGSSCFPSVSTMAKKSSISRRGTQKILRRLEDMGLLTPAGSRPGGARQYQITLTGREPGSHGERGSRGGRTGFRGGANQSTQKSEPGSPDSVIPVIDPSLTPFRGEAPKGASASRGDGTGTSEVQPEPTGLTNDKIKRNPPAKKTTKPTKQTDARYSPTRELLADAFREVCSKTEPPPWDGHCAKELTNWLASHNPELPAIEELVRNVTMSENAKELLLDPARLIPHLRRYHAPLDRYGVAATTEHTNGRSVHPVGAAPPTPPEPPRKVRVPLGLNRATGEERWNGFLSQMPERIGQHSYDTWLRPTRVLGVTRGVLYVQVPQPENASYLPSKYVAELKELLPGLKVEFRVAEEVSRR